jgi:hypothetical protein
MIDREAVKAALARAQSIIEKIGLDGAVLIDSDGNAERWDRGRGEWVSCTHRELHPGVTAAHDQFKAEHGDIDAIYDPEAGQWRAAWIDLGRRA